MKFTHQPVTPDIRLVTILERHDAGVVLNWVLKIVTDRELGYGSDRYVVSSLFPLVKAILLYQAILIFH